MTPAEFFHRLLDDTAATIAHPGAHAMPSDELHTEILLPLLPAMVADRVIRDAWENHTRHGFFYRLKTSRESSGAMPLWDADDFEIHVTASYLASPDAKALADTLLSEPSLRDLTAALMNQLLDIVWPLLPPPGIAVPVTPVAAIAPEPEPVAVGIEQAPSVATIVPPLSPEPLAIPPVKAGTAPAETGRAPHELRAPRTDFQRPWQWFTNNPLSRRECGLGQIEPPSNGLR